MVVHHRPAAVAPAEDVGGLDPRLDDLAVAGLTEFRDYLYYYNITDEIPELPLYELPEDWEDDEEPGPFL